jgi:hypothetical protein
MNYLEQWFQKKISGEVQPFRGMVTIGQEVNHVVGPRSRYAKVVLSASPAKEFTFISEASWPTSDNYDHIILQAILDVWMGQPTPSFGVSFVLKEIGWDDVNSDQHTFYQAARAAVAAILKGTGNWVD